MNAGSEELQPSRDLSMAPSVKIRYVKDKLATVGVSVGGISVIFAVLLIFFYLLWVVLPLFKSADLELANSYDVPGAAGSQSLLYAMEEQAELALRVSSDGRLQFFDVQNGVSKNAEQLDQGLIAATHVNRNLGLFAVQQDDGEVWVLKHKYKLHYPEEGGRTISAEILYPYGDESFSLSAGNSLAVRDGEDELTAVSAAGNRIHIRRFEKSSSFFDDSVTLDEIADVTLQTPADIDAIVVDPLQEWLYAVNKRSGLLYYYDIRRLPDVELIQSIPLADGGAVSSFAMLAGGISLLSAGENGQIVQWFPLRDAQGQYELKRIREFTSPERSSAHLLLTEHNRRGFMAFNQAGHMGVYYATSERDVLQQQVSRQAVTTAAVAPRANFILMESAGQVHLYALHNEHPEVSWSALWGKVWYESYEKPDYIWQSSAADSDFEPKFSLSPLSFGTLKAAFYAMLFAVPLAIGGAIYTAYFMSPGMRTMVKPTIEVMEALPTVILGFLAGLWLAPFIENHLAGVFMMVILLPFTMPFTGWLWTRVPASLRNRVPDGWQPAVLVLPIIAAVGIALLLSQPLELAFFGGSLPLWLDNEMGITYDQRNSLVVGLAMGFAVIPTIFSIAEDAIFSVPKQLTQGSLALGATPWQTLVRVVLPTASPGMFSALMIGMGRAVGETMIVLMATGNTPIMDFNIFEGFRTLSANIAVEMPESELGSTHYRILFLAGLVLFLFTFVFNTLAEVVRQRLRAKYGNL